MKRIQQLFALGVSVAVLASQACNSSPPGGGSTSGTAAVKGTAASSAVTVAGTLAFNLPPAAVPGVSTPLEVQFRDSTGALLDTSDTVTMKATVTVGGATSSAGGTAAAVHGVATVNVALTPAGTWTVTASSSQLTVTTAAITTTVKGTYSEDDAKTAGTSVNASASTAQNISPNVPIFGTLGGGEVHYYKFAGKAGQLFAAEGFANRLDQANWDSALRIRLIAPDGTTELARSSGFGGDANAFDTGVGLSLPTTGTYYLACDQDQGGFASGKFGVLFTIYKLPTGAVFQTETEAVGATGTNDTIATAQALVPGIMYGHYDNATGNVTTSDFYKISVTAAARLQLELFSSRLGAFGGGKMWDGALQLQNSAGTVLARSDNAAFLDPRIDYTVTTAGTYYVKVSRSEYSTNTANSTYALQFGTAAFTSTAETAATSTTTATAPAIVYGTNYIGSFTAAGTQYFGFTGAKGDVVRLVLNDKSSLQSVTLGASAAAATTTVTAAGLTSGLIASPSGTAPTVPPGTAAVIPVAVASPVVVIPAASSTVASTAGVNAVLLSTDGVTALPAGVASSTATESLLNTRQTILQAAGKYYVKVTSTAAGSFGIRVENVATTLSEVEPNDTIATGTAFGTNTWASGVIASATDVDHFKIHGEAGQLVSVGILAAAPGGIGTSAGDWGSSLIPIVEIHDTAGNLLATTAADRKGQTNFADSILAPEEMTSTVFRAPAGADYDVTVRDADGQGGAKFFYALHLRKNQ
ncbi:MAG TPA: PPC domain-containing protein [Myxococcales bacterium]